MKLCKSHVIHIVDITFIVHRCVLIYLGTYIYLTAQRVDRVNDFFFDSSLVSIGATSMLFIQFIRFKW